MSRQPTVRDCMSANFQSKNSLKAIAHDVMLRQGLLPDFSDDVLRELKAISGPAIADSPSIRDLRDLLWCSIDNDDSRDLDQLTVAQSLAGGQIQLLVAVADVDVLVKKSSALDTHASTNTTSVYTAAGTFPMLPERLSTDLTSLGQGVERLAIIVDMTVATDGTVVAGDIYRAVVVNKAKLAYYSVAAWLNEAGAPPSMLAAVPGLEENLRLQDKVTALMRKNRQSHGALHLETLEARPVFENEQLVDMRPDPRNRAKDLIEDSMVGANGVTARYLKSKGLPSLRRVLKTPKRWDRIVQLALADGYHLPVEANAPALDAFLKARREADPDHFADLSLSVIKLLGAGEYAVESPGHEPEGHFALAVQDYTHSTAPNRRFPDLITQRLLKAAVSNQPASYSEAELNVLATHCTLQDASAKKVERQVAKSAAALLLSHRIGQHFDGIITGVSDKGTWVRITGPMVEGKIVRGLEGLDVGDHVSVKLVHVDPTRGFIDFERAR
jgi:VacB/RNase II family 3'-5' exoribonuclease